MFQMLIRIAAVAFVALLVVGCDDDKSDKEASICKGLSETDCQAKSECVWNAEKSKCKLKKAEDQPETTSPPPPQTEQPPATQTPPPQP
jgi:hypothetical protein